MIKYFQCLFIFLIVSGCKSLTVLPSKRPVKSIKVKRLIENLEKSELKINSFRARIKATFTSKKIKQSLNINLRLKDDKFLWMSANILVPVAKLLMTNEKVLFYEKFQKKYYEGNYEFLNSLLGTNFRLRDVQNIFIGNPIDNFDKSKVKRIDNPDYYVFINTNSEKFRTTYFFDTENFRIREQRFLLLDNKNNILSVKYPLYQKIDGKIIPKRIEISSFVNNEFVSIILEFTRVDYPDQLTIPFKLPQGYSKIEI
tara:strand:+ start:1102 stop:1869 length:768 start_codon:yes stop_codon:yes gene_type:complete